MPVPSRRGVPSLGNPAIPKVDATPARRVYSALVAGFSLLEKQMNIPDSTGSLYPFTWNAPPEWRAEVIQAYEFYKAERLRDIAAGIEPSTDELEPWEQFLSEYLYAELENAAGTNA